MKRLTIVVEALTDKTVAVGLDHAVQLVYRGDEDRVTDVDGARVILLMEHDVEEQAVQS